MLHHSDNHSPVKLKDRPFMVLGDYAFTCVHNPYCAGFILDKDLAREYVNSHSFKLKRSCWEDPEVAHFGVRERAAMGLTFENAPAPFPHRIVVPVSKSSRLAPECTWLRHLPNNYADKPNEPMAKVAMKDLFVGEFAAEREIALPSFNGAKHRTFRLANRAIRKLRGVCFWGKGDTIAMLGRLRRIMLGSTTPKRA